MLPEDVDVSAVHACQSLRYAKVLLDETTAKLMMA